MVGGLQASPMIVERIRSIDRQHSTEIVSFDGGAEADVCEADHPPDALGSTAKIETTWVENRYTPRP
jgi:hypothetical protein